jgi:hypothetical protein
VERILRGLVLPCLLALLAGCAASPTSSADRERSDALLLAQLAQAQAALAPGQPPRVVFAGFALHSESKAFRGDVQVAEQAMRQLDPHAVVFKLANPAVGQPADWPFATRENVQSVLQAIASRVRSGDKVVLLLTSHGARQVLAVYAGKRDLGPITAADLQQWLLPMRGKPTLILLSACHSGSFIPALRGQSRIILAAAAADRTSFGCNFHSGNTIFIEELLRGPALGEQSILQRMDHAREAVQQREAALRIQASQPQSFVGPAVQDWSRQPMSQWLQAGAP